jgi:hypothetical protein
MKPYAEIRTVTKNLVDSLLAMNTKNRDLRKRVVDKYATDIKNGHWKLTNQGFGITKSGFLADGQHRLEAIKSCGYPPIEILLIHGLDDDVQVTVDAHAKRTARDMLQFAFDSRVGRAAPAIGNVILKQINESWAMQFTNHQLMEIIRDYCEEIDSVTNQPKSATFFAAPYLAAFAIIMKERPHEKDRILQFMTSVESGEMLSKTMPAYHLKNYIGTSKKGNGGALQEERLKKTLKALNCFLADESMGCLRA